MERVQEWQIALRKYIGEVRSLPVRPGTHDCALFVAGAIAAVTGVDLAAEFRGKYTTYEEGLSLLRDHGYTDHVDMIAKHLEKLYHPSMSLYGDIAIVSVAGDLDAAGIVNGPQIFVLGPRSLGTVPLMSARTVFRI